ncbi:hypothetical protein SAMN04487880_1315 [Marinobacter sp. es.042]|jgi:hypothetical protein|nr:hypothetical protein SAMN04487880_1315 [Marinobacter sp. es.042]
MSSDAKQCFANYGRLTGKLDIRLWLSGASTLCKRSIYLVSCKATP